MKTFLVYNTGPSLVALSRAKPRSAVRAPFHNGRVRVCLENEADHSYGLLTSWKQSPLRQEWEEPELFPVFSVRSYLRVQR